jgi:hypothetical protein
MSISDESIDRGDIQVTFTLFDRSARATIKVRAGLLLGSPEFQRR